VAARWGLGLVGVFVFCVAAAAQPPTLNTGAPLDLAREMETIRLPGDVLLDPDRAWRGEGALVEPSSRWLLSASDLIVGRATFRGVGSHVIEVPVLSLDEAQVWQRAPGGAWERAVAGDRVPLSTWPFANQFPAFPITVTSDPLDVMVAVRNSGRLQLPINLVPDADFRAHSVRRANLSGMVLGLGLGVAVVCLLSAGALRTRAHRLLAGLALWVLFTIACNNGYLALWLTPEWPAFNDAAKHFSATVMAGLYVLMVAHALDPLALPRRERLLAAAAVPLAVTYAVAQAFWLPHTMRIGSAAATSLLCVALVLGLCALNAMRGGRHVAWVAGSAVCIAAGTLLAVLPQRFIGGLDLRAAAIAVCLYVALLLMRHVLHLRERYGRDVLSRAAVSANRDPLTALWSYAGFQQRHAEAALREAAGQGESSMLLFMLPGLGRADAEHGAVLTERALVRFAATLHAVLDRGWAIGRVSHNRIAAVRMDASPAASLGDVATLVLSHCARQSTPVDLVAEFDLRIVGRQGPLGTTPLVDTLRGMEDAGRALPPGKRITLV
jgi:hypothetical protein